MRSSHLLRTVGPTTRSPTVLLRIEFTAMSCSQSSGGLLPPPFHPYLVASYISLASPYTAKPSHFAAPRFPKKARRLFRGPHLGAQPLRGGISLLHFSWGRPRRVLPVILALRSPDFPHLRAFRPASAAVQFTCGVYFILNRLHCQIRLKKALRCYIIIKLNSGRRRHGYDHHRIHDLFET